MQNGERGFDLVVVGAGPGGMGAAYYAARLGPSHPVSGEGIGFALEAGRLAAGWAAEAHKQHDYSATLLSGYAKQLGNIQSLRQSSTHALVALVNRLPTSSSWSPCSRGARRTPDCAVR